MTSAEIRAFMAEETRRGRSMQRINGKWRVASSNVRPEDVSLPPDKGNAARKLPK